MGAFTNLIQAAAQKYRLDPRLLERQLTAESGMDPNARSPAGALGLAQLMPGTARDLKVTDPRDPAQAIPAMGQYMRQQLDRFGGDYSKALAAYNWGPGNLTKAHGDVRLAPAETQGYLRKVLGDGMSAPAPASVPGALGTTAPAAPVVSPSPISGSAGAAVPPQPGAMDTPPDPSQLTNEQRMQLNYRQGLMADRGTLASIMSAIPGAPKTIQMGGGGLGGLVAS